MQFPHIVILSLVQELVLLCQQYCLIHGFSLAEKIKPVPLTTNINVLCRWAVCCLDTGTSKRKGAGWVTQ